MSQQRTKHKPTNRRVTVLGPDDFDFSNLQWSENHSPLRIAFHNSDSARRGRGLQHPKRDTPALLAAAERAIATLGAIHTLQGRVMAIIDSPAVTTATSNLNLCISVYTSWASALRLIVRANDHEISPYLDAEKQLMLSGYELLDAGFSSADLRVTCNLTPAEEQELLHPDTWGDLGAIGPVLRGYIETLRSRDGNDPDIGRALACLYCWMTETGKQSPTFHMIRGDIYPVSSVLN
jgi:hypothetical protein